MIAEPSPVPVSTRDLATDVAPDRLRIDVWSDVVCPWCHLGLTYLHRALDGFEHADRVDVVLRSYQLDPTAPVRDDVPLVTRLARKYGTSEEQVARSQDRLRALGAEVGIDFRFDLTARGNTFDAHRLLHLADRFQLRPALEERLFRAYFTDGEVVGDADTLRRLGTEVGLAADEVDRVVTSDLHADDVRADLDEAHRRGITGVPFFLFDDDLGLPGAQPPDRMLRVLRTVWADRHLGPKLDGDATDPAGQSLEAGGPELDVCGPEGCAV